MTPYIKIRIGLVSALLLAASLSVQAAQVGIASGNPTGTNYPMVEDIIKVCSTPSATIHNVVSDGSLDNIAKISIDKSTQYGIFQADAGEYMKGQDPKMMERILMVFPFFSTEMHLVSKEGSNITSLASLAGKRVVEGPEGSGTWVSAQVIKSLTGIKWTPILASQQAGFDMVLAGTADAEFIVAGAPVKLLQTGKGFKLVPMSHPALDSFGLYTKALIPSGMYPSSKGTVSTYKVDNILGTYAYKSQYQTEIRALVTCLAKNVDKLQTGAEFHPKWRDVDITDIERIKWTPHPAAVQAIKKASKK